jgi:hypothetical protein
MGIWSKKEPADRGMYEVQPGRHGDKELPGIAGYKHEGKLGQKNSMPRTRFKYVRPDGRPD